MGIPIADSVQQKLIQHCKAILLSKFNKKNFDQLPGCLV